MPFNPIPFIGKPGQRGTATGVYRSAIVAATSFTITHPNNANADKTFDYWIVN